ncbi:hypothetical protein CORMATOL_01552 [Corynebacterium matruchotii ATCC 33806]|uniref:Uncharacterized protein n=1 Tax=Corynebacterium matruchotii ATCC 33806 TaxID=566549 RepID=C0E3I8_9CORY|nr:hypothetical protein CORMATOL_01552 [Corynebacterium matruchotii ATCC 33806]
MFFIGPSPVSVSTSPGTIWTAIIIALRLPTGRTGGFMIVSHAVLWGYRKSVVHYWKITIIHHAFLILFFLY